MFKDTKDGQTHYENDGCGEPAHNQIIPKKDIIGHIGGKAGVSRRMNQEQKEWEKDYYDFYFELNKYAKRELGFIANKNYISSLLAQQREERENLLNDYSDWLHKEGFIDDDYYTVCFQKAPGEFLKHLSTKIKE